MRLVAVSSRYSFYADYKLEQYMTIDRKTGNKVEGFLSLVLSCNMEWMDRNIRMYREEMA